MTSKRVDPAASADSAEVSCPKCGAAMVRRVAKRGENAGSEFWGCSTFPKCRSVVPIEVAGPQEPPAGDRSDQRCRFSSPHPEPQKGLLRKAAAAIHGIWRWNLESDEPDATDRWNPEHRLMAEQLPLALDAVGPAATGGFGRSRPRTLRSIAEAPASTCCRGFGALHAWAAPCRQL